MEPKDIQSEGRTERKKKQTRQKIVKTAMELIDRQGFDNTTMEQIAEAADIARKTLYNHFPIKEAIVDDYVREISLGSAQETKKVLQSLQDTKSRLLVALDKAYEWVETNPEITRICIGYRLKSMYQGSGYSSNQTGTQSMLAEIIKLGQEAGEIRRDVPAKLLMTQIEVLRGAVVLDWLQDNSKFEIRKEMAKMVDLFLNGAINREEPQK